MHVGQVTISKGAQQQLTRSGTDPKDLIARHVTGDHGEVSDHWNATQAATWSKYGAVFIATNPLHTDTLVFTEVEWPFIRPMLAVDEEEQILASREAALSADMERLNAALMAVFPQIEQAEAEQRRCQKALHDAIAAEAVGAPNTPSEEKGALGKARGRLDDLEQRRTVVAERMETVRQARTEVVEARVRAQHVRRARADDQRRRLVSVQQTFKERRAEAETLQKRWQAVLSEATAAREELEAHGVQVGA